MDPLFPALPEDLGALSAEEIDGLIAEHVSAIEAIRANDPKFLGELSGAEVIEQLKTGVEQVRALRAALADKEQEETAYEETVESLASEVLGDESAADADPVEPDPEMEPVEPEDAATEEQDETVEEPQAVEEAEVVLADGARTFRRPTPTRERQGRPEPSRENVVRASSGLAEFNPGEVLDQHALRQALIATHEANVPQPGAGRRDIRVAQVKFPYPPERQLDGRSLAVIERVEEAAALTASGGLCAPFPSFYDLPVISVADRPVRDALTSFQATRGGVSVPTNLSRADVSGGVDIVTAANDELGGTFAAKNCVTIDCEPWTDYNVDSIYACVTHGNLNARAWPERVDAVERLLASQHATVAETNLLNIIKGGSTALADEAKYGAVSTFLQGVLKISAAYRSFHRTSEGVRLRALLPRWLPDMLLADMIHGQFDRFHPRSYIATLLNQVGVDVSYYFDSADGDGMVFAAQAGPNALEFPTTVKWGLFEAGAWLFLDLGELNLGVVRDSVLNAQNDFQIFRETFEGAAFIGVESLWVTTTICPDGTYAPAGSAITCA